MFSEKVSVRTDVMCAFIQREGAYAEIGGVVQSRGGVRTEEGVGEASRDYDRVNLLRASYCSNKCTIIVPKCLLVLRTRYTGDSNILIFIY